MLSTQRSRFVLAGLTIATILVTSVVSAGAVTITKLVQPAVIPSMTNVMNASPVQVVCPAITQCTVIGEYQESVGPDTSVSAGFVDQEYQGKWSYSSLAADTHTPVARATTFSAISCFVGRNCVAVGTSDGIAIVASESAGKWSSLEPITSPSSAYSVPELTTLSCHNASNCVAIGGWLTSGGYSGFTVALIDGVWQTPLAAPLPSDGLRDVTLTAIDCWSSGSCEMVGSYLNSLHVAAYVSTSTNGVFTTASSQVNGPAQSNFSAFSSVWCASAGNCLTEGKYSAPHRPVGSIMFQLQRNGVWAPALMPLSSAQDSFIATYSCVSVLNCVGFGYRAGRIFEEAFVNGAWSTSFSVWSQFKGGYAGFTHFAGCAAANCLIVGQKFAGTVSYGTLGTWSGDSFGPVSMLEVPTDYAVTINGYGLAVDCTSATVCTTLGLIKNLQGKYQAYLTSYTKNVPSTPLLLAISVASDASLYRGALSCSSAGNCAVVVSSIRQAYVDLEVGGRWQAPRTEAPNTWYSVSCPAVSWCVATGSLGGEGVAMTWAGSTWSQPTTFARLSSLNSVSCWAAKQCLAVGSPSRAFQDMTVVLAGSTWRTPSPAGSFAGGRTEIDFNSVSCTAIEACEVVGDAPYLVNGDRAAAVTTYFYKGTWAPIRAADVPTLSNAVYQESSFNAVSCVSSGRCAIIGTVDYALDGSPNSTLQGVLETGQMSFPADTMTLVSQSTSNASLFSPTLYGVSCASASDCVVAATDTLTKAGLDSVPVPAVAYW